MGNNVIIDINADVGEGVGNEAEIMPFLSSCSIACGSHAGNWQTMTMVAQLAKLHDVKIGAHPSFPDRVNFGRKVVKFSPDDLFSTLKHQVEALNEVLQAENLTLNHIKPHGALYNLAAKDLKTAQVIVEVIESMDMPMQLYAPYKSVLANLALQRNVDVKFEAFADRNYNDDLSLVSRTEYNAILHQKEAVLSHVLNMVMHQKIVSINGVEVPIKTQTICVHGDTGNALEILRYLNLNLVKNGIRIQ